MPSIQSLSLQYVFIRENLFEADIKWIKTVLHSLVCNCHDGIGYIIRKTRPCDKYPLEPHFYIVKLGYTGVYLIFLFLLQNTDCGYSLELTCTHNLCFEQKLEKYKKFSDEIFNFCY